MEAFIERTFAIKLRPFQKAAMECLLLKKDVFVGVPTGTGKTFTYVFLPRYLEYTKANTNPMVLCISPLVALMEDQVSQLRKLGIQAVHITGETIGDMHQAEVAFISPELAEKKLRPLLREHRKRVAALIVDEAHCLPSWGRDFRPAFNRVGSLRALIPDVPIMALTATATETIRDEIIISLCMTLPSTLHILPDRPNIMYNVVKLNGDLQSNLSVFDPIIDSLNSPKTTYVPKTLIYGSSRDIVSSVYGYFHYRIHLSDDEDLSPIAMFHKRTSKSNKERVLSKFPTPQSVIRVVVCTVAFGLGVNIPNVRHVINFGVPLSLEDFAQQSGRAGRDGDNAVSTLYHIPCLRQYKTDAAMIKYCSRDLICRRKYLAQHFKLTKYIAYQAPEVKPTPRCCDLCNPV